MSADSALIKPDGRVLSTLEKDGSRRWLYPKLAKGRFLARRRAVAYLLIDVALSAFILHPSVSPRKGDCIDCGLCVAVCPTGIDIRDGLQFECVGCAQCIDVCDEVMTKINRPRGLIRYGSQAGLAGEKARLLRARVVVYPLLILAIGSLLALLLATRSAADVTVLRGPGQPFLVDSQGQVINVMRVKITNRTDEPQKVAIAVEGPAGMRAITSQPTVSLAAGESWTEPVEVRAPQAAFAGVGSVSVKVRVSSADGTNAVSEERPFKLLGPTAVAAKATTGANP